jgi:histidinol dehydrogenase
LNAYIHFINDLAPAHLELMIDDPIDVLGKTRNAGMIWRKGYVKDPTPDFNKRITCATYEAAARA